MLERNFQAADLGGNNCVSEWRLHWLEAEGELQPWRTQIISEIKAGRTAISRLISPPRLDVLVQRRAGAVIPEIGMVGRAYRKSLFALTFDPDNERFSACLSDGSVRRQVAHEVHHCLRMAGPGYGDTLGEALVSEGLAGRFVGRLFGSPPEPWERAVDDEALCLRSRCLAAGQLGHSRQARPCAICSSDAPCERAHTTTASRPYCATAARTCAQNPPPPPRPAASAGAAINAAPITVAATSEIILL
jgi:hypothetical protein